MATKRICLACGKTYDYCPNCANKSHTKKWMNEYDEESCGEIFNVVSGYGMEPKMFTAKDVVDVLKKYNITDTEKYVAPVKALLDEATEIVNSKNKVGDEPKTDSEPKDSEPKKPKFDKKPFNKN